MGLLDNVAGRFGFEKKAPAVEVKAAGNDYSGAFASNSFSSGFITFNNKKAQLNSYTDWVYASVKLIAEECATIDLRAFKNNSKVATKTLANKLIYQEKGVRKYLEQTTTDVTYDIATKKFTVRKDVPLLEELDSDPLLDLLNSPNPFLTKNEFMEITFLHLELTGNAFWAVMERKGKQPSMLFPLMPSQMTVVPDAKNFVAGYIYRVNGEDIPFDVDDIIHHKYANPTDMRDGYSAVEAGSRAIDTDAHMAEWNRKTMYNDARISGFLTTNETLQEDVFKRVKQEFNDSYGGTANAYKVALLEGGMDFKQLSLNPKDMDFASARPFNRDQILAMFGVPKALIGLDESMSRANAEAAEYAFARYRIKPRMQRMANRITQDLAVQFSGKTIISFTDPVPENGEYDLKQSQASLGLGGNIPWSTINEERAKRGDDPIEGGDELLVPSGFVKIGDIIDPPKTDPVVVNPDGTPFKPEGGDDGDGDTDDDTGTGGSAPSDTDGDGQADNDTDSSNTDSSPSSKTLKPFPKSALAEAAKRTNPKAHVHKDDEHIDVRDPDDPAMHSPAGKLEVYLRTRQQLASSFELAFNRLARDIFQTQKQEVLALVNTGYKGQAYAKLSKQQQKAALGELFDKANNNARWTAGLLPLYKGAAEKAIVLANDLVNNPSKYGYTKGIKRKSVDDYSWNDEIENYFTDRAGTVSKGIDDETDKQLRATLTEGTTAGEDRQQLMDRVEKVYTAAAGYRADRIARTESQTALNQASIAVWDASDLIAKYIWLTSASPCPLCLNLEHTTASHPTDFSNGAPPIHPNCACEAVPYQFKSGERIGGIDAIDEEDVGEE